MRNFELADLYCLSVAIIWGVNIPLVKDALLEISPMSFNALRLVLAASLLWVLVIVTEHRITLSREDVGKVLALGLIGNTFYQALFIHGLHFTKAGNAALLLAMGTIFIALLSWALGHERLDAIVWGGIFISIGGVVLILIESSEFATGGTFFGDLLVLGASFCWSVYTVYSKPMMKRYTPLSIATLTLGVGALGFLVVSLPFLADQRWDGVSAGSYAILAYSFVFALAVSYILWLHGVDRLGSTRTAIYGNLVPFFGVVSARAFLDEEITLMQLAAGILILTGIYLTKHGQRRPPSVAA